MNILVIGSGAVGIVTAGILAQNGFMVDLACKNKATADLINNEGIIFTVKKRSYIHFVKAFKSVSDSPGKYDFAILATKLYDADKPARDVIKKLKKEGAIVSFQDGFSANKISEIVGSNKVITAIIGWTANKTSAANAEMTSVGEIIIGKIDEKYDSRLKILQYVLRAISPTIIAQNINDHIFSKLVLNSYVSTLGTITGLKAGAILSDKKMHNIFITIIHEAIEIANAQQIKIPIYAGKINYYTLIQDNSLYHRMKQHFLMSSFGKKFKRVKSTGLQALERGEKTEIEYINGYFVNRGKELGIKVPLNEKIVEIVKEIENKKRSISIDNLKDLMPSF